MMLPVRWIGCAAHLCPTIGAFSVYCNIWHRILGLGESASRPARRYGPSTRAGLIRSIFRQSRSAKPGQGNKQEDRHVEGSKRK
jgi:hypothetical protein